MPSSPHFAFLWLYEAIMHPDSCVVSQVLTRDFLLLKSLFNVIVFFFISLYHIIHHALTSVSLHNGLLSIASTLHSLFLIQQIGWSVTVHVTRAIYRYLSELD